MRAPTSWLGVYQERVQSESRAESVPPRLPLLCNGCCHNGFSFLETPWPQGRACCSQQGGGPMGLCAESLAGALPGPRGVTGAKMTHRPLALVGRNRAVTSGTMALERVAVWQKGMCPGPLSAPGSTLFLGRRPPGPAEAQVQEPAAPGSASGLVSPALPLNGLTLGKTLTLSLPQFPCHKVGMRERWLSSWGLTTRFPVSRGRPVKPRCSSRPLGPAVTQTSDGGWGTAPHPLLPPRFVCTFVRALAEPTKM